MLFEPLGDCIASVDALADHVVGHGPVEVEALAHGTGGGEQVVGRERQRGRTWSGTVLAALAPGSAVLRPGGACETAGRAGSVGRPRHPARSRTDRGQPVPGRAPDENRQRVFGGQVAGQALVAASRTVDEPGRLVHSLHAYFLRPGDPSVPIVYEVDRIRDGKSFSTRRVVAIQHGRAIFNLQASFHDAEPGLEYQMEMPADVPAARVAPRLQDPDGAVPRAAWASGTTEPAADRHPLHRPRPVRAARVTTATGSGCGCAPTAPCPTTRCCTRASSRTRAT
jgi:hypothetical protein